MLEIVRTIELHILHVGNIFPFCFFLLDEKKKKKKKKTQTNRLFTSMNFHGNNLNERKNTQTTKI